MSYPKTLRAMSARTPKDDDFAMPSPQTLLPAGRARRGILVAVGACAGIALGLSATSVAMAAPPSHPGVVLVNDSAAPASAGAQTLASITADAGGTLQAARTAVARASSVAAEAAEPGLDLATTDTAVETAELRAVIDDLSRSELVPVLLLPAKSAEAAAKTRAVDERVATVQVAVDAARAKKAAEEAAAQAQRDAEAAAAAEAQRQAEAAAAAAAELAAVNTPDGAKVVAQRMASERYGWGSDQFSCLVSLWQRESSWNYQAYNAGSGATGIPQALPGSKMASAGSDWQTNAATQITWGLQYISSAYGSPCGAWGKSQSSGWY